MSVLNGGFGGSAGADGGSIDTGDMTNSLRFRASASANLYRVPSSSSNRYTWTWSGWVKLGKLSGQPRFLPLFAAESQGSNEGYLNTVFGFGTNTNKLEFLFTDAAGSALLGCNTNSVFRDASAWYHVIMALDTTQASSTDGLKIYVNGIEQTLTIYAYTQNAQPYINTVAIPQYIGYADSSSGGTNYSNFFDGYLSRIAFVDGAALTPSSFGYTNSIGVWTTKSKSAVKAVVDAGGTNSFMLEFDDATSLTTLGYDASSKGNNWTCNNMSLTAGSLYDAMDDVPGNSYAIGNPLRYATLTNGNLRCTNGGSVLSTIQPTSGKWYFEAKVDTMGNENWSYPIVYDGLGNKWYFSFSSTDSTVWIFNNAGYHTASSFNGAVNDILKCAVDLDSGKIWFGQNNTWFEGDPSAGTGASYSNLTSGPAYTLAGYAYNTNVLTVNYGQHAFAYTPPTGFQALCTANLPVATIANPAEHFDVVLDTGANIKTTAEALFTDQLVWIKDRANANNHQLMDSVRGVDAVLQSNTDVAETTYSAPSGASVGWAWKANGTGVTNTDGTITSTVSANTTAGFSIVTYTGTGANATVGHGLGVAPGMIVIKNRTDTATSWIVGHRGLTNQTDRAVYLNTTDAELTSSLFWNNTAPTSSVFSLANYNPMNGSGDSIVAYCFAEIPGYSKLGAYAGDGSTDGPFVYCGFRPKFVMVKMSSSTGNWVMLDSDREGYNVDNDPLWANLTTAEGTTDLIDILSNGFKIRSTDASVNTSSGTYIYAVFAEHPFKYSNAR